MIVLIAAAAFLATVALGLASQITPTAAGPHRAAAALCFAVMCAAIVSMELI